MTHPEKINYLASRAWLAIIAAEYGRHLSCIPDRETANGIAQDALLFLRMAPWHLRLLVGSAEVVASLWSLGYRLAHAGHYVAEAEFYAFEKVPIISSPLLRLYRSLVALHWFERPIVCAHYGITEAPEEHQASFRNKRREALLP